MGNGYVRKTHNAIELSAARRAAAMKRKPKPHKRSKPVSVLEEDYIFVQKRAIMHDKTIVGEMHDIIERIRTECNDCGCNKGGV
jgi:hypothetical protein